jgi:ABC-2 type transport system permease protein
MTDDEAADEARDGEAETTPNGDASDAPGGQAKDTDADSAVERTPGEKVSAALSPLHDRLRWFDWYPIVTKEFADTIRSRALIVYSLVLLSVFAIPPAIILYTGLGGGAQGYSQRLFVGGIELVALTTSLAGIAFGYAAVSGERERGSMKLLLAQPFDRRDVLVGKLFGRFAAVTVPLVAVILLRLLVVLPSGLPPNVVIVPTATQQGITLGFVGGSFVVQYLVFIGLSMALALVFVGFGIGVSAGTATTRRSFAVAGGVWAYLFLLWGSVSRGVPALLDDLVGLDAASQTQVELLLKLVNPAKAFQTLLYSFSGLEQVAARVHLLGSLLLTPGRATFRRMEAAQQLGEGVPWYLTDVVAVASLALWLGVPLLLGYWHFRGADL